MTKEGPAGRQPLKIKRLEQCPAAISILEKWFIAEWSPWYGQKGQGDARTDLLACCTSASLSLAVVALDETNLVMGMAALKNDSLGCEYGYGPWLSALLVGNEYRGRGIGSLLIEAIEEEARGC